MKRRRKILLTISLILYVVGGVLTLTACASSPVIAAPPITTPTLPPASPTTPAPTAAPALSLGSKQSGDLTISLFSNPNPPIRGSNVFEAVITDVKGQPISDATVSLDIDMTNMSHGKNVINASSSGEGRYVGNIYFLMPGPWRVIVSIGRAGQINTIRFDFTVNWR